MKTKDLLNQALKKRGLCLLGVRKDARRRKAYAVACQIHYPGEMLEQITGRTKT
jgi:hypothetical protein